VSIIQIIADDRERRSSIPAMFCDFDDVELSVEHLSLGDYLIDNWLLIERKALKDFVESIIDGRVFGQASRLVNSNFTTAIILEGCSQDIKNYHIHRHSLLGAIVTIGLVYGIPILRSANRDETVRVMLFAARQRHRENKTTIPRCGRRPKNLKKRQLFILQGLPDVGPVNAKRLLDHFGSVRAVFTASFEQLCEVEGVGAGRAGKIFKVLGVGERI
jgi:DNA excision repair protein ERCC-4